MARDCCRQFDAIVRRGWPWVVLLAALAIWGWFDVMPRGVVDPSRPYEHRTDFTVYTEAGAAFFDGRQPYQVSNARGWRYLYPPMFALAVAPLHRFAPEIQVAVWFAISVALLIAGGFEMRKALKAVDPGNREGPAFRFRTMIGLAAGAAVLFPLLNGLQRGQVEVLKLYLLLLGFRILVRGTRPRDWCLAGTVLSLPIVLKLTPALPVLALILFDAVSLLGPSRRRLGLARTGSLSAGVAAGLVAFALVIPGCLLGWQANLRHLETWFDGVAAKAVDVRSTDFGEGVRRLRNQSLDNAAYRCGNWLIARTFGDTDDAVVDNLPPQPVRLPMDDAASGTWIVMARLAALAMFLCFIVSAGRSGEPLARASVFGLACVATLVVCPVARGSYFLLLLPGILFSTLWLARLERPRLARWLACGMPVIVCVYYLVPMTGRVGLLGLGTTAWFFITCAGLDRSLARRRALRSAADDATGAVPLGDDLISVPPRGMDFIPVPRRAA